MYCYNCTASSDEVTLTYSTTNVSRNLISNYAKIGDGAARIKLNSLMVLLMKTVELLKLVKTVQMY